MPDRLVTIATFDRATDARMAQGKLRSEGIECCIADEHFVTTNWLYSNLAKGIKLQVLESDTEVSLEILKGLPGRPPSELSRFRTDDEPCCPECKSHNVHYEKWSKRAMCIGLLLLGFPLLFLKRKWVCEACGHAWRAALRWAHGPAITVFRPLPYLRNLRNLRIVFRGKTDGERSSVRLRDAGVQERRDRSVAGPVGSRRARIRARSFRRTARMWSSPPTATARRAAPPPARASATCTCWNCSRSARYASRRQSPKGPEPPSVRGV